MEQSEALCGNGRHLCMLFVGMHYVGGRIHINIHRLTRHSPGLFNSHTRMTMTAQKAKTSANAYMEFLSALLVFFGLFYYGKGNPIS